MRIGTSNNTKIFIENSSGYVGIGTDTPHAPLHVEGGNSSYWNGTACRYYNDSGAIGVTSAINSVSIYANGRLLCRQELDVISDERAKENIEDLSMSEALRFVNVIHPKIYNYKKDNTKTYGYIAQHLLNHSFNDLVSCHVNEDMEEHTSQNGFISPKGYEFSITKSNIIPFLHLAIKDLNKKVDTQGSIIDSLIRVIDRMEERLNRLSSI
jgi:hypothetical protein